MRKIHLSLKTIEKAMQRAERTFGPNEWQARCIEIALIPAVYRRLRFLNQRLDITITRHAGKSDAAMTRDERMAETDWTGYAGYTLELFGGQGCWNRVVKDYYAHNPGSTFNGMGRELYRVQFIHDLRMIGEMVRQGKSFEAYLPGVWAAGIEITD